MSDDEGAYEVGYRKPPKHTRFKTGQSGNPAGRPRKYKSAISVLEAPVAMTVGGKKVKVSAFEASLRKTAQSALEGHLSAMKRFFKYCNEAGLLIDRSKQERGGVYYMPIDPDDYPDREFTAPELGEIKRINAGLNKQREPDPQNEKDQIVQRVASEKHHVPSAGGKMTVYELIQHKLRHRALVERHEPSHAFFEKILAQTTLDLETQNVGYMVMPAPVPMWLSPLEIEDGDTDETVKVPSPGEPGFDQDDLNGSGKS